MAFAKEPDSTFVGRAAELDVLRAALAQARAGRGRLIGIAGDAGIGKTRLVEELVADVPAGRVLWGRCLEQEGAPSYWPWVRAFRALVELALAAAGSEDSSLHAILLPAE